MVRLSEPAVEIVDPIGQYDPRRTRKWHYVVLGGRVHLRHVAVLADGEDLTENPPTHVLSQEAWAQRHGRYGLNVDGSPAETGWAGPVYMYPAGDGQPAP